MENLISKSLSRVYVQRNKAEVLARAYANKMLAKGYKVSLRTYETAGSNHYLVDVFCKK